MTQLIVMRPHGHEHAGHQDVIVEEDIDLAQKLFDEAVENGYLIYAKEPGRESRHIMSWDEIEDATQVIATPQLVGG